MQITEEILKELSFDDREFIKDIYRDKREQERLKEQELKEQKRFIRRAASIATLWIGLSGIGGLAGADKGSAIIGILVATSLLFSILGLMWLISEFTDY
jgi:hypothetical protein